MSFLDRVFGSPAPQRQGATVVGTGGSEQSEDERALERYRYMMQTAPPETVELAHAEAFAKLTPEQREQLLSRLVESAPEAERSLAQTADASNPRSLARFATHAELGRPGTMERALGGAGFAGFGGSLLSSFAAGFLGSMVAQSFFAHMSDAGAAGATSGESTAGDSAGADGDFSEEFGQGPNDEGIAGGTGFEDDEFDAEV